MRLSKGKACSSNAVRDVRAVEVWNRAMSDEQQHALERIVERGANRWTVREMNTDGVPGASAPRCLICESDDVVRRIWRYPENWIALSDDDLIRICDRSVV
jgi:hypothetical protein